MNGKVLVVEDEQPLGQMLKDALTHEGFDVEWVADGYSAVKKVFEEEYSLVILDLMLPKMEGIRVCKRIRECRDVPIIMLTAKTQIEDRVEGLSAGADDYITKPFSFRELLARINAVLRRYRKEEPVLIKAGDLELRLRSFEVYFKGERLHTTKKEFDLLRFLMERAGQAVSREELYLKLWGNSYHESSNIVDVYIKNLRNKLGDRDHKLIRTVRGFGYMLVSEDVSKV